MIFLFTPFQEIVNTVDNDDVDVAQTKPLDILNFLKHLFILPDNFQNFSAKQTLQHQHQHQLHYLHYFKRLLFC